MFRITIDKWEIPEAVQVYLLPLNNLEFSSIEEAYERIEERVRELSEEVPAYKFLYPTMKGEMTAHDYLTKNDKLIRITTVRVIGKAEIGNPEIGIFPIGLAWISNRT